MGVVMYLKRARGAKPANQHPRAALVAVKGQSDGCVNS